MKRPTSTHFANLTLGDFGGTSGHFALDLGGPIDKNGRFGYRVNVAGQGLGETSVADQKVERMLESGALDWHISKKALLQIDAERHDYRIDGQTPVWFFGNYVYKAPDASKDWGQPWSFARWETSHEGAEFRYDFTDKLDLRAAYRFMWNRYDYIFVGNEPSNTNNGTYNVFVNHTSNNQETTQDSRILMDYSFKTGPMSHKLTFGFMSWHSSELNPFNGQFFNSTQLFSLYDPAGNAASSQALYQEVEAAPIVPAKLLNVGTDYTYSRNIGDQIVFDRHWSALVGLNYATILAQNYTYATGVPSNKYDKSAWTPTASLIYKPISNLSAYFTYIQGLEIGGFAGASNNGFPVSNPG
jgi:iron complex outermembrane receptor protein